MFEMRVLGVMALIAASGCSEKHSSGASSSVGGSDATGGASGGGDATGSDGAGMAGMAAGEATGGRSGADGDVTGGGGSAGNGGNGSLPSCGSAPRSLERYQANAARIVPGESYLFVATRLSNVRELYRIDRETGDSATVSQDLASETAFAVIGDTVYFVDGQTVYGASPDGDSGVLVTIEFINQNSTDIIMAADPSYVYVVDRSGSFSAYRVRGGEFEALGIDGVKNSPLQLSNEFFYFTSLVGVEPGQSTLFRKSKDLEITENLEYEPGNYFSAAEGVYPFGNGIISRILEDETEPTPVVDTSTLGRDDLGFIESGAARGGSVYFIQPEGCETVTSCESATLYVVRDGGDPEPLYAVDPSASQLTVDAGCLYWFEQSDSANFELWVGPR